MRAWNGASQALLGWIAIADADDIGHPETPLSVFERDGWKLWVPCELCGGVALPLEADSSPAALNAAQALRLDHCWGCQARSCQQNSHDGAIWFDPHRQQWLVAVTCGHQRLVLPLDVSDLDPAHARQAADELVDGWVRAIPSDCPSEQLSISRRPNGWYVWLPCPKCGGFAVSLPEAATQKQAQQAAAATFDQHSSHRCLGCRSHYRREHGPQERTTHAWFDVQRSEWMLWYPLGETAVEIPLDVHHLDEREQAQARYTHFLDAGSLLIPCTEQPHQRIPSLTCSDSHYQLHIPCAACGAISLAFGSGVLRDQQQRAERLLRALGDRCLGCEAQQHREADHNDSQVWFDPSVGDWLLARTIDSCRTLWQLGVPEPDASAATISFAALDLLSADDEQ
jgi:hypothetical protein